MSPTALFLSAPWCRGRRLRDCWRVSFTDLTRLRALSKANRQVNNCPAVINSRLILSLLGPQRALHATFRRTNSRWDLFHALPTPVQALAGQELSTVANGPGPPLSSFSQLAWKLRLLPGCGLASMKSTTGLCAENRFSGVLRCRSFIYCPFATVTASHRTATFSIRATASIRFSSELA